MNRGNEPQKRLNGCLRTGNMMFFSLCITFRGNRDSFGVLLSCYPVDICSTSSGSKDTRGLKLANQLYLASNSKLWNSTSTSPYVFMAWCWRAVSLTLIRPSHSVINIISNIFFSDHKVPKSRRINERMNMYFDNIVHLHPVAHCYYTLTFSVFVRLVNV
jgi:hypothetical protein